MCYLIDWGFHIIAMGIITTRGWACAKTLVFSKSRAFISLFVYSPILSGHFDIMNRECLRKLKKEEAPHDMEQRVSKIVASVLCQHLCLDSGILLPSAGYSVFYPPLACTTNLD